MVEMENVIASEVYHICRKLRHKLKQINRFIEQFLNKFFYIKR